MNKRPGGRTVRNGAPKSRAVGNDQVCSICFATKSWTEFTPTTPYSDGTPRVSSECRPCKARMGAERKERQTSSRIVKVEAPRAAIDRLIDKHPEIIEQLQRRYAYEYLPLFEEEKERLLTKRANYLARVRERRLEKIGKHARHTPRPSAEDQEEGTRTDSADLQGV